MRRVFHLLLVMVVAQLVLPQPSRVDSPAIAGRAFHLTVSAAGALHITVNPSSINVGRDMVLSVAVSAPGAGPVAAHVTITGAGRTASGTTVHGAVTLTVHATVLGSAQVLATATGYGSATVRIPIVPGPPAAVVAIVHGVSILAPPAAPSVGAVGSDLFQNYHALTANAQLASLGLRDGTLIDLNSNTDVVIQDPLHTTLNGGEILLQVVHGAASHQVQAGSVVAATKGTVFDVRYTLNPRTVVVTVLEGSVLVSNGSASTLVSAGEETTVVRNLPPHTPKPLDLRPVVRWVFALPNTVASTIFPVQPTPTLRPTATPTLTFTPTATPSPSATATLVPTATPTPTVTDTAVGAIPTARVIRVPTACPITVCG